MISGTGFGRARQAAAITSGLSLPAGLQQALGSQSKIALDDDWATLGTTPLAGRLLGWSFEFKTGLMSYHGGDARADKDFTGHWINPEEVDVKVEITLIVDSIRTTELAMAAAAATRALRIEVDGSADRKLRLDMLVTHEMGSLYEIGNRDGQDIVVMPFMGTSDGTNFFSAEVSNLIAALA